jgi:hypothetical protein
MKEKITSILHDLYQIEPSLKTRERELYRLIESLLLRKPDTQFDEAFALRLRNELMATAPVPVSPYAKYFQLTTLRYGVVGALVALIAITPVIYYSLNRANVGRLALDGSQKITTEEMRAFGALRKEAGGFGGGVESDRSFGGAPKVGAMPDARGSAMMAAGDAADVQTTYRYGGEAFSITEDEALVFERVKGVRGREIPLWLRTLGGGLINIDRFTNISIESIELTSRSLDGYLISINMRDGVVSINPDWQSWGGEAALPEEMPSREAIITIAEEFIAAHELPRAAYGDPIINEAQYAPLYGSQGEIIHVPEVVEVVYPLRINGIAVYEENGVPHGLQVSVHIRKQKVYSVYNLVTQKFIASHYPLQKDAGRVLEAATGGTRGGGGQTATLRTPARILARYWIYNEEGIGRELYVPALLFPVDRGNGQLQKDNIVVPLVEDLL